MASPFPVVDIAPFVRWKEGGGAAEDIPEDVRRCCEEVGDCLASKGVLVVRDPRVSESDNARFLDMMERYFEQAPEKIVEDARPEWGYQVGVTPSGVEFPRCATDEACLESIRAMPEEHRAQMPTGKDPKWRYMWRVGARPTETRFQELNEAPVIPSSMDAREWTETMDMWGGKMMACVRSVSEMAAVGFGMADTALLRDKLELGPHLLAPTATDVARHHALNEVYAGYHYDMNFLTIHGKSRFPGLHIWTRGGERLPVSMPEGCLLLQAGKELEWLTGGHVRAGMHEVICSEGTLRSYEAALRSQREGAGERRRSTWRISSTLFSHVASDQKLEPVDKFRELAGEEGRRAYPPTYAGDYVSSEIAHIKLAA